jgi:hypothetical protein
MSSLFLAGCSSTKGIQKSKPTGKIHDSSLISAGENEVMRAYGQPTSVNRTPEGHIFWVYEPPMKLWPSQSGTRYVEFENSHVVKIFKIK